MKIFCGSEADITLSSQLEDCYNPQYIDSTTWSCISFDRLGSSMWQDIISNEVSHAKNIYSLLDHCHESVRLLWPTTFLSMGCTMS